MKNVLERQRRPAVGLDILDVGCGTGLAATLLRPAAKRLVGIDLSKRMLAKAREKGGYDRLIRGDLVAHMLTTGARYDVLFAADVFVYLGDLEPATRAARRVLRPRGLLALSLEWGDGTGYHLNRTQRYAHSLRYIRDTARACGLAVRHARAATIRYEGGLPVRAALVVLENA